MSMTRKQKSNPVYRYICEGDFINFKKAINTNYTAPEPFVRDALESKGSGSYEIFKYIIDRGMANNYNGTSIFHHAAYLGRIDCLKYLQDKGRVSDVDIKNNWGHTAFQLAVYRGKFECADYLIDQKADIENRNERKDFQTALHQAAYNANYKGVRYLIDEVYADVSVVDKYDIRPIDLANKALKYHKKFLKKYKEIVEKNNPLGLFQIPYFQEQAIIYRGAKILGFYKEEDSITTIGEKINNRIEELSSIIKILRENISKPVASSLNITNNESKIVSVLEQGSFGSNKKSIDEEDEKIAFKDIRKLIGNINRHYKAINSLISISLRALLLKVHNNKASLDWSTIYRIGSDIGYGLYGLHRAGIVYRVLTSSRVLLSGSDCRAIISDYGLFEKITGSNIRDSTDIRCRSPESFNNKSACTEKSDVYRFGIVLWELASKKTPYYKIKSDNAVIAKIARSEYPDVEFNPSVPRDSSKFKEIVDKCWGNRGEPESRALPLYIAKSLLTMFKECKRYEEEKTHNSKRALDSQPNESIKKIKN